MDAVLHPKTKRSIEGFLQKPAHSVLLVAPIGSGKTFVAKQIATKLLGEKQQLTNYAFFHTVTPVNSIIAIEAIRSVKKFLQLRTTGKATIRRVVLIEDSQCMNQEAQNALLKILEEPPSDTLIILTATTLASLPLTIRSRVQTITVQRPLKDEVMKHFLAATDASKLYHMSSGKIGLMSSLANNEIEHPLVENIQLAKTLLTLSPYERLLKVNELNNIENTELFLEALYSVGHAALRAARDKANEAQIKRWHKICQVVHSSQEELKHKPQNKLLLTNLLLNL